MERYYFRGDGRKQAAQLLFGKKEDFDLGRYEIYEELELALQEDGRFSVWGNLPGDSQLLRDTHPDFDRILPQLLPLADRMEVEEPLPDDGEPWVDPNDLVDFEGWE
ncbi:hypothetical protein [Angelakisella massiliensis]|uniref:hypothetical protein n=1 Tax=Angelakisella massiliensis TaxID=1871018 RepID=UPI0008F87EC8|nr:hypothetical protein [Angelakisella massiliensis]